MGHRCVCEGLFVLECPDPMVLCSVDLLNAAIHGKDVGAVDDMRMSQCAADCYAAEQRGQGDEDCR